MILDILFHLVPNAQLVLRGEPQNADEYVNNVEWLDERPQPSWTDIETNRLIVEKKLANYATEQVRAAAYRSEADPLFFGWQRNENTEQEWLDKVAEIRARHPYL